MRALCIINPGNPTGAVLSESSLQQVISFCQRQRLILLSDEVYQMNVYTDLPFISARSVACRMGGDIEIISFNSISKGLVGECGHRGGYFECHNIDPFVLEQFYKQCSINLCANVPGQVLMNLMVDPPILGEESFAQYKKETDEIWMSLKRRGIKLKDALSQMEGVTCNEATGAMYLFPKIQFPDRLLEHAQKIGKIPDEIYAMELLNTQGIVTGIIFYKF